MDRVEVLVGAGFARAFAASPAAMIIRRGANGPVVEVNQAMCALLGHSRDQLIGSSPTEIVTATPALRDHLARELTDAGQVVNREVIVKTATGDKPGLCSLQVLDIDGVPHMLATVIDLSAHRTSEQRLRELASAIDEVFWLTNSEMTEMLYISPGYERIWGRSCASLTASPLAWLDAVHPDDRERVDAATRSKHTPGGGRETYRIVRPDGGIRWICDRWFPIHDDHGTVVRIAGVAEDVTERRELEAQLRQTQKLESIGLLAGGVAHDFNNLLTVVLACADELRGCFDGGDPAQSVIAELDSAAARGVALTRQLLAFSRKQRTEPQRVDVATIVTDTDKMLRRLVGEDVVVTTVLAPELPPVLADPGQLTQVLMNLAVNARDAMPRGGELRIETHLVTLGDGEARARGVVSGRFVAIVMADTGTGMSQDVRAHLFEPFFTTKTATSGTGLGLSVSHGIVAMAGGHIEVESEVGRGSRFTVYLPATERRGEPAPRAPGSEALRGNETLLVVEDMDDVRRVIVRMLRARGYQVLEAHDGIDALQVLDRHAGRVDLMITDVVMPEMDGRRLAEHAQRRYPGLPILFTTGYTSEAMVQRGVLQTEISFVQKPFDAPTLLTSVRAALELRRAPPG